MTTGQIAASHCSSLGVPQPMMKGTSKAVDANRGRLMTLSFKVACWNLGSHHASLFQ
jgi:hypothetical protein